MNSMFNKRYLVLGAALLATASGCAGMPTTTRTGMIHEVRFAETMSPTNLRILPGDEVRWVNQRNLPVTVEFLGDALSAVSCERGFSKRGLTNMRGRLQESTSIGPNDSASLCFTAAGTVTYNARMESAVAGGQTIESGTIRIE
jgi:plastocyanin